MTNHVGVWTKLWARASDVIVEYSDEVASTNDLSKNFHYTSDAPVLFVTGSQSKGRGRGSNVWINAGPGTALLSTWSFSLDHAPQPITTPLLGLAVYRSLKSAMGISQLSLKAPNDIYIDEKKAGGLLVEVISQNSKHRLSIGLGLNVLAKPEIENATCIQPFSTEPINTQTWNVFLSVLYDEFQRALHECTKTHLSEIVRAELLIALNTNPNLAEKYIAVELNGSLRTKESTIPWTTL